MITKKLKYADFNYDEKSKTFAIFTWGKEGRKAQEYGINLDKVYAFALMRFIIRIAQSNWLRQKRKLQKTLWEK